MRILHATDTFGPTLGGIEVMVRDLAARQAAEGHEVTVLTRTPGPASSDVTVTVSRDPSLLADLVRRSDVVHAHVSAYSPLALRAAETAAAAGVPAVAAVHSMWGSGWPLVRAVAGARGWLGSPIQWAAVSEAAAGPVRRALPGRRVIILPNAVDVAAWATDARPAGPHVVTIVSVMRMVRRKRPLALVETLRRLRDQLPPDVRIRAVLVGDGPQRPSVLNAVARHGMDGWVSVPGSMDHEAIRDVYRSADVFVAPATLESFGIAALEARAAGLAVVTRAGTGVSDFVTHEQDGLVAGTSAELASALVRLCTDPRLLADLRTHSARHPPAFDWSDVLWRNAYGYELAAELAHGQAVSGPARVSPRRPALSDGATGDETISVH
jgi:glycosyltransferase involved in cell wall biosynthesis